MAKYCTVHKDGTVSVWSVPLQSWRRRVRIVPADDLAAMSPRDRARVRAAIKAWCQRCGQAASGTFNGPICTDCRRRVDEEIAPFRAQLLDKWVRARRGRGDDVFMRESMGGFDEVDA